MSIRVLIVDDEELVRTGLRLILEAGPDLTVVGTASDGAAAVAQVRRLRPDVVLMPSGSLPQGRRCWRPR